MTKHQIEEAIKSIRIMAGDYEVAHGAEDALRDDFIEYISELGIAGISEKAKLVLSTRDIDFARYCA